MIPCAFVKGKSIKLNFLETVEILIYLRLNENGSCRFFIPEVRVILRVFDQGHSYSNNFRHLLLKVGSCPNNDKSVQYFFVLFCVAFK